MVNRFLIMFFLGMTMSYAQLVKVEVNLDSIASIIERKDNQINALFKDKKRQNVLNEELYDKYLKMKDSMLMYQKFYDRAHEILTPRAIARIKEDE